MSESSSPTTGAVVQDDTTDDHHLIENNFKKLLNSGLIEDEDGSPKKPFPFELLTDDLMDMYAYYKQATIGDCPTNTKPYWFQFTEKMKWESWVRVKGMNSIEAKKQYLIKILESIEDEESEELSDEWKNWLKEVNNPEDHTRNLETDDDVISFALINKMNTTALEKKSVSSSDENTLPQPGEVEVIKIGDLKTKCVELERYLINETHTLRTLFEEKQKKIAELEECVKELQNPNYSLEEIREIILSTCNSDTKQLVENIDSSYQLLIAAVDKTNVCFVIFVQ
ncbi:hypothetical protein C9374_002020 [Naegleria lovaniensis]|uniref:ACB domain-containing protein n=1 Tax=Naegleria lovaniensis TaxID=51637 RepID=A0AA88GU73_NAELO|nr:uncharacterized protein C9374_002020 [Naegleria lovaniensis]KAG2386985.1 hypothetical protein C9374_002020 [Naegleria lovaniensis]